MKNLFTDRSLSEQFLLLSFPILLGATLAIGWWVGRQVEDSVVHRIGAVTALYVDSFVAPHVQTLRRGDVLSAADIDAIGADLANTPLGQKIVSLKIWRPDGLVLYSNDAAPMGRKFPIDHGLADALAGHIFSEISARSNAEQTQHGQPMPRLIETYTPIHADRTGEVIAAAEFYERPDEVDREAGAAQRRSWLLVAGSMLTTYLMLFVLVRRGSRTIVQQRAELSDKVLQLTQLNQQNQQLQERVIRAAERATALNENLLQRISADIHDGPGQDLGFALMQLQNAADATPGEGADGPSAWSSKHLEPARLAVQSALLDLRAISSDLELPDIGPLGAAELVARVVRDFQGKTGTVVNVQTSTAAAATGATGDLPEPSFRVKVTLYRLLQESLSNAHRHAQGRQCRVLLHHDGTSLHVEISDSGPGFDTQAAVAEAQLGLRGMRQRVEVLGGTFELRSAPAAGTTIRVTLPLHPDGHDDD
jgi:signal transduction histidine kinase